MKKILLLCLVALTLGLGACNTMEGVGRDIQAAGDSLSDSADDNKSY